MIFRPVVFTTWFTIISEVTSDKSITFNLLIERNTNKSWKGLLEN